jgi:hypothetical protein
VTRPPVAPEIDHATRRALAVGLFNYTWTLLEHPDRTPDQDDEMLHAAHASRYHWGEPVNLSRGEWQVARVYCVLGRAEPALFHARRCVALNEAKDAREDWELGSAYEAMAPGQRGGRRPGGAGQVEGTCCGRTVEDLGP